MTIWHEDRLLIDGALVPAANGATYETIDPATEEVLGTAADASVDDAARAIAAARRAFDTTDWSRRVVDSLVHAPHSPTLGRRIWPE